jgi:nitrogen fixation protein FixH
LKTYRTICIVVLLAAATVSVGCKKKPAPVSDAQLLISLGTDPARPRMVGPTTFRVHVTDEVQNPVSDAQVTAALTMKLMDMPPVKLTFEPKGNGYYEATVRKIEMSGPWGVVVEAKQGSIDSKEDFDLMVNE